MLTVGILRDIYCRQVTSNFWTSLSWLQDCQTFKICTCGARYLWIAGSHVRSSLVKKVFCLGDLCDGVPPVPFPNTEAKTISADDTWTARTWESRSSPRLRTFLRRGLLYKVRKGRFTVFFHTKKVHCLRSYFSLK